MEQIFYYLNPHKYGGAMLFTLAITSINELLFDFFFNLDFRYIVALIIALVLDTITGVLRVFVVPGQALESAKLRGLVTKIVLYAIFVLVARLLTFFSTDTATLAVFGYVQQGMYGFLIVVEAWSILENLETIRPGTLPIWLRKKFKAYVKKGPSELNNPTNETT